MASNPFDVVPTAETPAAQPAKNPFSSANRRAHVTKQKQPEGFVKPGNKYRSASLPDDQKPSLSELLANRNKLDQAEQQAQIQFQQAMAKQVAAMTKAELSKSE